MIQKVPLFFFFKPLREKKKKKDFRVCELKNILVNKMLLNPLFPSCSVLILKLNVLDIQLQSISILKAKIKSLMSSFSIPVQRYIIFSFISLLFPRMCQNLFIFLVSQAFYRLACFSLLSVCLYHLFIFVHSHSSTPLSNTTLMQKNYP